MIVTNDTVDRIMAVMEAAFDPAYGEAWNRRQITDALVMPSTHALLIDRHGEEMGDGPADPAGFVLTRAAPGEEELLLNLLIARRQRGRMAGGGMDGSQRGGPPMSLEEELARIFLKSLCFTFCLKVKRE